MQTETDFRVNTFFHRRWLIPVMTFVGGAMITAVVIWFVVDSNQRHIRNSVAETAQPLFDAVTERIFIYTYGMYEARTAVISGGGREVNRAHMIQFGEILNLPVNFPGARGFGFVRRVAANNMDSFLQKTRRERSGGLTIKQIAPHDGERYILEYLEPEGLYNNSEALGLDIGSESRRRSTADMAMRSGEIRMTAPIRLVDSQNSLPDSFLLLLPLYDNGKVPDTQPQRMRSGFGWINTPLKIPNMLEDLSPNAERLLLSLSDVSDLAKPQLFFQNSDNSGFYPYQQDKRLFGRVWRFQLSVTPAFIESLHLTSSSAVAAIGLLISILSAILMALLRAQQANRESLIHEQTKLHAIVESSVDGIIGKNLDGTIISWNHGAESIFGYPREEAIGQPLKDLVIPKRLHFEEEDILTRIARGETISGFESIRRRKDGSEFAVSATVSPVYSTSGKVIGAAKTVRDISEQKAAQAQIEELNALLEQQVAERTAQLADVNLLFSTVLSAASGFGIIATDTKGIIKLMNFGAEQMTGYTLDELVDKATPAIWHDLDEILQSSEALSQQYGYAIEGFEVFVYRARHNEVMTQEWTYIHRDGTRFPVALEVTGMRDENDEIVGFLGIATNISQRKRAEQAMIDAKEAADAANAAKSMFLANMSHEIRTPMNAVLGMLQLLLKTRMTTKQHDFALKARIAATSLLSLLNDILDYSKIESGKLELDPQPFDFHSLMEHLAVVMTGNLRDKPVELLFDLDEQLPSHLIGDELRLQQVLINLLSNAIKFTQAGEVVVKSRLISADNQQVTMNIAVQDSGIGISKEHQSKIFESFTQAETTTTRRYGGTGLGLVISRRLIELMGGSLEVESELGRGSEFSFQLTMPIDHNITWQPPAFSGKKRILVVDDNDVARLMIAESLRRLHASVDVASSGEQALTRLDAVVMEKLAPYDCVILDWLMPGLDGLAVAGQIQQRFRGECLPKIILISAANHSELPERQAGSAFDAVLSKPVTPRQLLNTVVQVLDGKVDIEPEVIPVSHGDALAGLNILLVEDNVFNQSVAMELLTGEGARVDIAADGAEGVYAVQNAEQLYDVVLMDMQMPQMDGLTATRLLREQYSAEVLPVIAMTANVSQEDQDACRAAGMNAHLGKPLDFAEVTATILKTIGQESTLASTIVADDALTTVLARFGGNRALFGKLLASFWPSFSDLLRALSSATVDADWSAAQRALHTMKGSAGTVGLSDTYAELVVLEKQSKELAAPQQADFYAELAERIQTLAYTEYQAVTALLEQSSSASDSESAPVTIASESDFAVLTDELAERLSSGDMEAITLAQQLCTLVGEAQQSLADKLLVAAENLEFANAQELLNELRSQC